jgi:hypothetical protein
VQTQRTVVGVGRVDLLIGDRLLIEADGVDNHDGPSHRHKDLVRDANAAAWGLVTLRFDYALIVHDWDLVEAAIVGMLATLAQAPRVTIDARLPPPLRSSPPLLATQLQGAGLDTPVTDGHGRRVAADASQFGIRHAARTRAGDASVAGVSRAGSGGTRSWMP